MQDGRRPALDYSNSATTGWLLSCLVHGGLALATILFMQHIHLAPQGEPFQWNVAMVATLSPSEKAAAPSEPTTPPTKRTPSSIRSAQRIESTAVASAPPTPTADLPPPSQEVDPLQNESRAPRAMSAVPAHPSSQLVPLSEQAPTPSTEINQSPGSPSDMSPASDPVLATNTPAASAGSLRSVNVDYGWLAALMAQWIEGLDKRYPAALRAEGIEGKVTLIALLHEDGSLTNVRIAKGSGNTALDQVALEDVRNGPPVKFAHPLQRPQISVKFSISYDLKTTQ